MTKLHIQIREKTKRDLTPDETFAYIITKNEGFARARRDQASEYLNDKGVSVCGADDHDHTGAPIYKRIITTTRDATPGEIMAYYHLQIDKVCKKNCNDNCPFDGDCLLSPSQYILSKDLLNGKEAIVSVVDE